ncbi:hypothetical protein GF325_02785 [Candidatus Bathyarchaeota archaeon]|nr:hypothetical protein [Candidatus Bathyarchaeota archaeon]
MEGQPAGIRDLVPGKLLRDVPGWKNAPVPACFGGDPRSLTFCCHPGYSLTFSFKCRRDELLAKCGLSKERFVEIKDKFSRVHGWEADTVCFKSFSYCCMRRGGCPGGRDHALQERYPNCETFDDVLAEYFSRKRQLALELLHACENKDDVQQYILAEENT